MMGDRQVTQEALFYEFSVERHVPAGHLVRSIDRFVDLTDIRTRLRPFYSGIGHPSIDPELLKRTRPYGGRDPDMPHADGFFRYRASKLDCDACMLKPRCCPGAVARKVPRSVHEGARNLPRAIAQEEEWITSRREHKKVEMLFAHLKRILRLDRLRLRGPNGARDEFHLAAAAQNLRKLAKLIQMPAPTPA